jgi:prepilin-type N-terminal cleavage/methylation domain-containing protein
MKTSSTHRPATQAFTLIELLVVIAIIALLASIAVPAGNVVLKKARQTQAKAMMKGLEIAIKGYQTEYNRYPLTPAGGAADGEPIVLEDGNTLIETLVLPPNASDDAKTANPRNVKFYDPPVAKGTSNGLTPGRGLMDPWGSPFTVVIDYDNDGQVTIPDDAKDDSASAPDPDTLATGVIVYTSGPAPHDKKKDYVRSWR